MLYEGNAKGFIHFIIINSTKHRLNERSNTIQEWPLSDHIVRKWYNAKMHWNREERSGISAMKEEREEGLERAQIV